jgi:hypothetical protein
MFDAAEMGTGQHAPFVGFNCVTHSVNLLLSVRMYELNDLGFLILLLDKEPERALSEADNLC